MGEEQHVAGCCLHGEDRISGLPNELLHVILARLRCARAAARTIILSRRWRCVWAHLPELVLYDGAGPDPPPPTRAPFVDAVDAALRACLAPTLERLAITLPRPSPARRAAPWLRFAAQREVGALYLSVPSPPEGDGEEEAAELELPACKGAKRVTLFLAKPWRLQLPPGGSFTALTSLTIYCGRMEGSELTSLVCTRCPRLKILSLFVTLVPASDFTIRSGSLCSVFLWVKNTRRLEIVAPELHQLSLSDAIEARISALKLAKFDWHGDVYDPRRHQFVHVGRRLQRLQIDKGSGVESLIRQFDEVDELELRIHIPWGREGYQSFLNETNSKLPKCKTLSISLSNNGHGLAPATVHLLRSCNSTRTLLIALICSYNLSGLCPSYCPCHFEESCRIDDISLNLLEELKITSYSTSSRGQLEFVEHLFRCNAPILRRLVIKNMMMSSDPSLTKETCEKIRNMCHPNIEVEFYVRSAKGAGAMDLMIA